MSIKDQILEDINKLNEYNKKNNIHREKVIDKLSNAVDAIDFKNINEMNGKKLAGLTGVVSTYISALNEMEDTKIKQIKTKVKAAEEDDNSKTNRNIVEFIKTMNEKKINERIGTSTDEVLLDERLVKDGITVTDEETSFDVNDIKDKLISELGNE